MEYHTQRSAGYGKGAAPKQAAGIHRNDGIDEILAKYTGQQTQTTGKNTAQGVQHHGTPALSAKGPDPFPVSPYCFQGTVFGLLTHDF